MVWHFLPLAAAGKNRVLIAGRGIRLAKNIRLYSLAKAYSANPSAIPAD
jgi:hypothetical protein